MPALKEFANFITLNKANLVETYVQQLAEVGYGYEAIPANRRMTSARRVLKAVIECYETDTSAPLALLFDEQNSKGPRRWAKDIDPPYPFIEIECLGQTLAPVVTDLEASKFLWQILSEIRTLILPKTEEALPLPASRAGAPPSDQIAESPVRPAHTDGKAKAAAAHPVAEPEEESGQFKQATQALQENERRLQTIMNSVRAGIVVIDAETRQIVEANPAALHMIGAEAKDVVGAVCHKFICPAEKERCPVCDLGQTVDNSERVLLTAQGEAVPILKNVATVSLEGRKHLVESFVDISERKQTETIPESTNNFLERVIDGLSDPLFVKDEQHRWVVLNQALCDMLGYSKAELIGKSDYDISPKEQADIFWEHDEIVLETGQTDINEEETTWRGEVRTISTVKSILVDPATNKKFIIGTIRDITELKRTQNILAKRAHELETVAQVGTAVSTILDTQELLQTVVDLTKERFDLYHTHIYLLNASGDTLVLTAGAGAVGRQMVSQGWRIVLAQEQSLVARAGRNRKGSIVNNVREEPGWLPNDLLPDTRAELAMPLIIGDRLLGVLDVQSDEIDHFQEEDLYIQTILAAQVAVALQNAAQHEETHLALSDAEIIAREQAVLNELGQALTARLNVEQVLEEVYRQASRLVDTTNFYVGLYQEDKHEIIFPFMVTDSDIDHETSVISADEGLAGYIVRHKTTLLFEDDVRARQEALGIALVGEEPQSWLGVPLLVGDRVIGVMAVQSFNTPRLYDEHSRELLLAIGSQVAIAVQNATLFENIVQAQQEAESRLRETQILQRLTQTLAGTLAVDEVIDAFFRASTELLDADYGIFSLVDEDQQRVIAMAGVNVSEEHLGRANHPLDSDDIMADIVRTGKTEIITGWDPRFDPETFAAEGMAEWGLKVFTPITIRRQNIGLVEVGFKENIDADVQETQVKLLRTLVDQTAVALESAQRYEESQKAARREQAIRQITEKMRAATSLEELVRTTAEALGERLSAGHAVIDLGVDQTRKNGE